MIVSILRRIILPALAAGFVANYVAYEMLDAEGALSDFRSMGYMSLIVLVGLIIGGVPAYRVLAKTGAGALLRIAALLIAGFVTGGIIALFLAWTITDENIPGYIKYGLAAGVVSAVVWMIINYDLLRPEKAGDSHD